MPVFLVLFDAEDSMRLQPAFDECGEKFRLSGSSCLLHSPRSADEIRKLLKRLPELRRPESLFVISVPPRAPVGGEVHRWLRRVTAAAVERPRDRPAGESADESAPRPRR